MCDDGDLDYDDLEADFCDQATEQADYEDRISKKLAEMEAAGENLSVLVLGDYMFKARAKAKLAIKGLIPNDAIAALTDPNAKTGRSNSSGEHTVWGQCSKGRIRVVYTDTVGKEERARAPFTVITAFLP